MMMFENFSIPPQ